MSVEHLIIKKEISCFDMKESKWPCQTGCVDVSLNLTESLLQVSSSVPRHKQAQTFPGQTASPDSPVMGPLLLTMSHRVRLDGDKSSSAPELAHTSFQEPVAKVWGILRFQVVEQSLLKIKLYKFTIKRY